MDLLGRFFGKGVDHVMDGCGGDGKTGMGEHLDDPLRCGCRVAENPNY